MGHRITRLCLLGLTLLPWLAGADDPASRDAVIAPLASQSLLLDLARAGSSVVAVGERGHVLRSTDDGRTWVQVKVPGSANLTAVFFLDEQHGWAVGHAEMILRTVDGGASWERVHFSPENQQPLLDVWFRDLNHGMAVGAYGTLYVTDDGGSTWTQKPFEPVGLKAPAVTAPADEAQDEGYAAGYDFHLNAIARGSDGAVYLAAEAGRLFRSDDGGTTWLELPSPYDGSFYGVLPLAGESLLAFGLRGNLFRSDNRGQNWTAIETGTVALLNAAVRLDDDTIVVVGMAGVLLLSRDAGQSFALVRRDDRKAMSGVLAAADGELIIAGEAGVMRQPVPR